MVYCFTRKYFTVYCFKELWEIFTVYCFREVECTNMCENPLLRRTSSKNFRATREYFLNNCNLLITLLAAYPWASTIWMKRPILPKDNSGLEQSMIAFITEDNRPVARNSLCYHRNRRNPGGTNLT